MLHRFQSPSTYPRLARRECTRRPPTKIEIFGLPRRYLPAGARSSSRSSGALSVNVKALSAEYPRRFGSLNFAVPAFSTRPRTGTISGPRCMCDRATVEAALKNALAPHRPSRESKQGSASPRGAANALRAGRSHSSPQARLFRAHDLQSTVLSNCHSARGLSRCPRFVYM